MVADTLALMFAAGTLILSFGSSAWMVKLAKQLQLAGRVALGAAATASGAMLIIDSMELSDLAKLVAGMQEQLENLKTSKEQFTKVQSIFANVVVGVNATQELLEITALQLTKLEEDNNLNGLGLSSQDAQQISFAWEDVEKSTTLWIDAYNSHAIVPLNSNNGLEPPPNVAVMSQNTSNKQEKIDLAAEEKKTST